MEVTSKYIQFKKKDKLLLWFIKHGVNILSIGSTFINSQNNKVEIIRNNSNILKIKCPSGDYEYHKDQILDYLKSGKYSDFTIYYDESNIHTLLNPIFNYYHNKTTNSISYSKMINFYSGPNNINIFLNKLRGYATFDIEEIFNNYFGITTKPKIKKWDVGTYVLFLKDVDPIKKYGRKGDIDFIETSLDSSVFIGLKNYLTLCITREKEGEIKWFATKAEAEIYRQKLKQINYAKDYSSEYLKLPNECFKKSSQLNYKLLLI